MVLYTTGWGGLGIPAYQPRWAQRFEEGQPWEIRPIDDSTVGGCGLSSKGQVAFSYDGFPQAVLALDRTFDDGRKGLRYVAWDARTAYNGQGPIHPAGFTDQTDIAMDPSSATIAVCWYEHNVLQLDALVVKMGFYDPQLGSWQTRRMDTVDEPYSPDISARSCSIDFDPSGSRLGLTYYLPQDLPQGEKLYYAYSPTGGHTWHPRELVYGGGGRHNSLEELGGGVARVAFMSSEFDDDDLSIAERAWNGGWVDEVVDPDPYSGYFPSMVSDPDGNPVIHYVITDMGDPCNVAPSLCKVVAATRMGGDWSSEIIWDAEGMGEHLSSAIGPDGVHWLSFAGLDEAGHEDLFLASGGPGNWVVDAVDYGGWENHRTGLFSTIAIDRNGFPVVAYQQIDAQNGEKELRLLRHSRFTGSPHRCSPEEGNAQDGTGASLGLDRFGNLKVIHHEELMEEYTIHLWGIP